MNKQKGVFKNLYKNLVTPILKKDSGIDAEYLTNLSLNPLKLLFFNSTISLLALNILFSYKNPSFIIFFLGL